MIHTDARFSEAVAARVAEVELTTDAELVVVAAERSGAYADVSARAASVVALLAAAFLLAIPWHIGEAWFLLDVALAWLLAERVFRHRRLVRPLTRASRRAEQVREAAASIFHDEAVHGTPHRTGVLVYVSALEGRVEVVPDLGIEGRVPRGELLLAQEAFRHDDLEHFLQGLGALGEVLARHVPHTEQSDATDLPNAPRVRA